MAMDKKEKSIIRYFSSSHKKTVTVLIGVVLIILLVTILWGSRQPKVQPEELAQVVQAGEYKPDLVYFYGQECARCKNIDKFIIDNKINVKISFAEKEVWHDGSNDMEMRERAKECGLNPEKVGVPFLWARGDCYIGEVEVEKFLKSEVEAK
ncbi:MAG: hypothetical protein ACD_5C00206G0004 [uncultured bacterium]|nr:MAG: hypothetical protein ACD_5C00206G0004 [uncultured bacterium]